jgi:Flp pilus assembly protein TadD
MTPINLYLLAAQQRFDQGDFHQAIEHCREALFRFEDHGPLWELYGTACWLVRAYEDAKEALETASCLQPLSPLGQIALAGLYTRTGHVEAAQAIYDHLTQPGRCPLPLLAKVAAGYGRLGAFLAAQEVCEYLVAERPMHHAAWFGIAYYRLRRGEPAEVAVRPLATAFELAPERVTYRLNLALLHAELGNFRLAYDLIRHTAPEHIGCACLARRLRSVVAWAGNETLLTAYDLRLAILGKRRSRGWVLGAETCSGPLPPDEQQPLA